MTLSKNTIKLYQSLQQKKNRDKEQLFIIEGKKIVEEAIVHHSELVVDIICTENAENSFTHFSEGKLNIASYKILQKISSLKTPQEVLAVLRKPKYLLFKPEDIKDLTLVLDSISDPGNLGTIIRLADWFGVRDVVCSKNTVDCFNPKTVQATMGGILRVNTHYIDIKRFITTAQKNNIPTYGTGLDGKNIYETEMSSPGIIIMGNESKGISKEIKNQLSQNLLIPDFNTRKAGSESLNVSTATAIVLSEYRRQQHYSK